MSGDEAHSDEITSGPIVEGSDGCQCGDCGDACPNRAVTRNRFGSPVCTSCFENCDQVD